MLEVLRAGPAVMETGWDALAAVATRLAADGKARLPEVTAATMDERQRRARSRWSDLCALHPELAEAA